MGSTGNTVVSGTTSKIPASNSESKSGTTLAEFQAMSLQDANAFANKAYLDSVHNSEKYQTQGMNWSNSVQGLVEHLDMHDKPIVLSDADYAAQFKDNALHGVELFRGFDGDAQGTYQQQFLFGDKTFIGDGVHGEGIYMTTKPSYAVQYTHGSNPKTNTVTGFIDKSKAKVITESKLQKLYAQNAANLSGFTQNSYALYLGYNVIHVVGGNNGASHSHKKGGQDFYIPLTREILVMREHTKLG